MRKTEYGCSVENAPASGRSLSLGTDFTVYREDPAGFARDVLGSRWWEAQIEIADALATQRRVVVKAANGVGKTYLAADLVLWFLYSHVPSVVLTTAPTWRQVESLLWEEIRRRVRAVNFRAELDGTRPKLEGSLLQTKLKITDGHFAMGLSTDEPVRFQGFHADDLLVVLDEACGVPEEIWDAVEGVCVGRNNRVLAISNPLSPTGRFYGLFKSPRWKTFTISALQHPNVLHPDGTHIPGAVTKEAVEDRIATWCEAVPAEESDPDLLRWEGRRYRPDGQFRARVLGEFPESASDSVFELKWLEAAMQPKEPEPGAWCVIAADVARFGSDETILAVRRGSVVTKILPYRGLRTTEVADKILALAQQERADVVTVDEIGIGAGVVDTLHRKGLAGLVPVNFASKPIHTTDGRQYLNLRAQTYFALRDRLREREVFLPRDEMLQAQLANLRYGYSPQGLIQIESKDEMRRRGLPSPDRADAVVLLFGPSAERQTAAFTQARFPVPRDMQAVPVRWNEIGAW